MAKLSASTIRRLGRVTRGARSIAENAALAWKGKKLCKRLASKTRLNIWNNVYKATGTARRHVVPVVFYKHLNSAALFLVRRFRV